MDNPNSIFREIENGALYASTTELIRQKRYLKSILKDSNSHSANPFYEEMIDKVVQLFSKKLELALESRDIEWEQKLINQQFNENFSKNTYENQLLREELEHFVVTEEGRKLFPKTSYFRKRQLKTFKRKRKSKIIVLNSMRLNYFREINNLREINQPWRSSETINDYLQVRFF